MPCSALLLFELLSICVYLLLREKNRFEVLMEKGQSFGSADEFRKKKGSLPLAVFLSFNDRDVHPQCPNASNPYHKCGGHCLYKIPTGNKLFDGESSGGSSTEWDKMSDRSGVKPNCPNASNPYHKCADYCFTVQNKGEKVHRKGASPGFFNALNSFHKHAEYCSPGNSTLYKEKNKGVPNIADRTGVHANCKHASNPFHKCAETCFEYGSLKDHPEGVKKPKGKKIGHPEERGDNSECKNASNPYHVCADYCFQDVPGRGQTVQGMKLKSPRGRKELVPSTEITGVNPRCRFASNPFHKCAEYCFQNVSDDVLIKEKKDGPQRGKKGDNPVMENRSIDFKLVETSDTSNTLQECDKKITSHTGIDESESVFVKENKEAEANVIELSDTQPLRIDAFDLFHEWAKYCSLKATEDDMVKKGKTGQRGSEGIPNNKGRS